MPEGGFSPAGLGRAAGVGPLAADFGTFESVYSRQVRADQKRECLNADVSLAVYLDLIAPELSLLVSHLKHVLIFNMFWPHSTWSPAKGL